ncbi:hypothetical protein PVK06_017693 [Gossypium arboreum]|uniref:DUF4283 domain-containing protein n=1 Tax=Gossypium arboreum TaxID=29729 RepID=A0ABR0Q3D6_GOSAR|nr:hypothetical protein PVK06_017693 [Gossypium arboreum]
MGDFTTMDDELVNLNIMDDEEDPMVVSGADTAIGQLYDLCMVGQVLTDSVVNFPSLKNMLADLWHPLRGVDISKLEGKRVLFKFYSEIDLIRVMEEVQEENVLGVWRFTGFYGALVEHERRESWELLRMLQNGNNKPWLVAGDFNEILFSFEKQ